MSLGLQLPNAITSLRSGTIIQQAKAFVNTETEKYSDRDGEVVSNRNMLANALEDTVQTEAERKRLQEYKNKIALIDADQKRLTAMRQKAQELRTKKGRTPKETQAMRDLDNAAQEVEKRITNSDERGVQSRDIFRVKALDPGDFFREVFVALRVRRFWERIAAIFARFGVQIAVVAPFGVKYCQKFAPKRR